MVTDIGIDDRVCVCRDGYSSGYMRRYDDKGNRIEKTFFDVTGKKVF